MSSGMKGLTATFTIMRRSYMAGHMKVRYVPRYLRYILLQSLKFCGTSTASVRPQIVDLAPDMACLQDNVARQETVCLALVRARQFCA